MTDALSRIRRIGWRPGWALPLLWAVSLGGCGDLTAGGVGEVEVVVGADSVPLTSVAGQAPSYSTQPTWSTQVPPDSDHIEGTLNLRIQVFVLREPNQWVQLTDGIQEVELSISNPEPLPVARTTVPAGRYRAVRTVFRSVVAFIDRGLELDGEAITGRIPVNLSGQDRLHVDRSLEIQVVEEGTSTILVDLHAARWLRLLNRERRDVGADDFTEQVRLTHRPSDHRP